MSSESSKFNKVHKVQQSLRPLLFHSGGATEAENVQVDTAYRKDHDQGVYQI